MSTQALYFKEHGLLEEVNEHQEHQFNELKKESQQGETGKVDRDKIM